MLLATAISHAGKLSVITLFAVLAFLATACSPYGPRQQFGNDVRANLIVFFRADVTDQEIEMFWNTVVSNPVPGKGFQLQEGISGIYRGNTIQGHASLVMYFWDTASPEQRDNVIERIRGSPLVYKVLEDTIPNEVTSIE